MFGFLMLTMFTFGNKPGAMHPAIMPFLFYFLFSPVISLVGIILGLIKFLKNKKEWIPLSLNLIYLIGGSLLISTILARGMSV